MDNIFRDIEENCNNRMREFAEEIGFDQVNDKDISHHVEDLEFLLESIREKFRDLIINNLDSSSRVSIDRKITIRDGDIYTYQDVCKADVYSILENLKMIVKHIDNEDIENKIFDIYDYIMNNNVFEKIVISYFFTGVDINQISRKTEWARNKNVNQKITFKTDSGRHIYYRPSKIYISNSKEFSSLIFRRGRRDSIDVNSNTSIIESLEDLHNIYSKGVNVEICEMVRLLEDVEEELENLNNSLEEFDNIIEKKFCENLVAIRF